MAKAKEQESTGLSERQLHIVGSFEIVTPVEQPHVPLHLVAAAQDNSLAQVTAFVA
jgi:hypothetical protein